MTGTGFLLILVGVFVALNTNNIVGVLNKKMTIGRTLTPSATSATTPVVAPTVAPFGGGSIIKTTSGGPGGGL